MNNENDVCVRDLPRHVSYYKLNEDGSYQSAEYNVPAVFIDENQARWLWDEAVAAKLRETYGPYIGIIHNKVFRTKAPGYATFKYVLGA